MPIQDVKKTNAQHAIPQNFMDVEFKIIGSLTMRQFLYLLVFFGTGYLVWRFGVSPLRLVVTIILVFIGLGLAFVPLEERGLDEWIVNFFKSIYSPSQRVWRKEPEVPSAFTAQSMDVVNQELITLAPTSSRRKLEEYLHSRDTEEVKPDVLDIPESYYTEKARSAFAAERSAARQVHDQAMAAAPASLPSMSSVPVQPNLKNISSQAPMSPAFDHEPEEKSEVPVKETITTPAVTTTPVEPDKRPKRRVLPPSRPSEIALTPLTPDRHSGRRFVDLTPGKGHIVLPIRGEKTIRTSEELGSDGNIQEKTAQLQQLLSQLRSSASRPTRQTLAESQIEVKDETKPQRFKEIIELKKELREEKPPISSAPVLQVPSAPVEVAATPVAPPPAPVTPMPIPNTVVNIPATQMESVTYAKDVNAASPLEIPQTDIPNVIYGVVKDSSGSTLSDIVLIIKDDVGSPVRALKSNSLGQFFISTPLSDGKYTVEIDSTKKTGLSFDIISVPLEGGVLLPMEIVGKYSTPKVTATTQEHLDIEEVKNDLVILKNGGVAAVLETTAVNFNLLSEIEQDAIIAAFSMLLNSITFPVQVVIRSKRLDITKYLEKVKRVEDKLEDPLLKHHAGAYRKFVQEIIRQNEVLDKKFYVVVPYGGGVMAGFGFSPFYFSFKLFGGGNKKSSKTSVDKILKNAVIELMPKVDHVAKEFNRIGIKAKQMTTQELVELYFDIYNPSSVHGQRIRTNVADYRTAIVNPAIVEE
ncbi:MAG: PrgI family protein [Patescibacteria group bacterium]|jgi:hypothetical protein